MFYFHRRKKKKGQCLRWTGQGGQKRPSGRKAYLNPDFTQSERNICRLGGVRLGQAPGYQQPQLAGERKVRKVPPPGTRESWSLKAPRDKVTRGPNRDTGHTSKTVRVSRREDRFSPANRKLLKPKTHEPPEGDNHAEVQSLTYMPLLCTPNQGGESESTGLESSRV